MTAPMEVVQAQARASAGRFPAARTRAAAPAAVEVAVAIVRSGDGRVLLAERRPDQIAGGHWELPGGKIEPGETPEAAVGRELAEETGLRATSLRIGPVHDHAFPARQIRLNYLFVEGWTGTPHGREGQRIAWVDPRDRTFGPLLPSNRRMIDLLSLPGRCVAIDAGEGGVATHSLQAFEVALAAGERLFRLSAGRLAPSQRVALGRRIAALANAAGARVLLEGTALEAHLAGLAGIHVPPTHLDRLTIRPNTPLWSAAVRDERELRRAEALGADLIFIAPTTFGRAGHLAPELIAATTRVPAFVEGNGPATLPPRGHARPGLAVALPMPPWTGGIGA